MEIAKIKLVTINDNTRVMILGGSDIYVISYDSVLLHLCDLEIAEVGEDWNYSATTTRGLNLALDYIGNKWDCNIALELSEMSTYKKDKYFNSKNLIDQC